MSGVELRNVATVQNVRTMRIVVTLHMQISLSLMSDANLEPFIPLASISRIYESRIVYSNTQRTFPNVYSYAFVEFRSGRDAEVAYDDM